MTATQDLIADPVTFLKNNIVVVGHPGDLAGGLASAVQTFKLYAKPSANVRAYKKTWRKPAMPVYFLVLEPPPGGMVPPNAVVDDPATNISAYFCPYTGNQTHGVMVGGGATLMFTAQMDGCSMGIGAANPAGDRLVFHSNEAGSGMAGNPFAQSNAQDTSLRNAFTGSVAAGAANGLLVTPAQTNIAGIVAPRDYRVSRKGTMYNATTVGVNAGATGWKFYAQRFETVAVVPTLVLAFKELKEVF